MAAVASEAEEVKLPEVVERVKDHAKQCGAPLIALSAAVKRTAPILAESNVALRAVSDEVHMEVIHCDTMHTFKVQLRAEDLEKCGFHARDTAEDCVEIITDALSAEDIDTVAVTPMAAPAEGSDTATASVKVPFSECEFLRIFFALKFRKKLYEYTILASEQKLDATTRTELQLQSLKQTIKAQKTEIGEVKAAMEAMKEVVTAQLKAEIVTVKAEMEQKMEEIMEATAREILALKSKGIVSFRSNAMVGRFRKWDTVECTPTLEAMVALSDDQSEFRIGIEGVYRVLCHVSITGALRNAWAELHINGSGKCISYGGQYISTVLCFVGRLRVADTVKVRISENEYNNYSLNWLQIEKL